MTKKEIKFRDPVVERVVDKFVERSDVGFKKYKQTLHTERKTGVKDLAGYLNDVQAEAKDKVYGDKVAGLPYYVTDVAG